MRGDFTTPRSSAVESEMRMCQKSVQMFLNEVVVALVNVVLLCAQPYKVSCSNVAIHTSNYCWSHASLILFGSARYWYDV